MWPLAIGAGIVANVAGVFLAAACSRAGWLALSRLVQLMRWRPRWPTMPSASSGVPRAGGSRYRAESPRR